MEVRKESPNISPMLTFRIKEANQICNKLRKPYVSFMVMDSKHLNNAVQYRSWILEVTIEIFLMTFRLANICKFTWCYWYKFTYFQEFMIQQVLSEKGLEVVVVVKDLHHQMTATLSLPAFTDMLQVMRSNVKVKVRWLTHFGCRLL